MGVASSRMTLLAPEFAVHRRTSTDAEVVAITGDLDVFTARGLRTALEEVIWRSDRSVVIDLTETDSIDTHALAALLNAARRLGRKKRAFTVLCPRPSVRRAFDVTGVSRQLTVVDALPAAVGAPA
jgi:anti-sigma B factor antagonist